MAPSVTGLANMVIHEPSAAEQNKIEAMRNSFDEVVKKVTNALDATYINFVVPATTEDLDLRQPHKIILFATGTHALAQWRHGEDIHLICTTDGSEQTFWAVVKEKLQLKDDWKQPKSVSKYDSNSPGSSLDYSLNLSDRTLSAVHTVHDAVAEVIKLCQKPEAGCKFYLHLTKRPPYFLNDIATENTAFETTRGTDAEQIEPAERHLDTIRDMRTLATAILRYGDPMFKDPIFMKAYSHLHYWAFNGGLKSRELGYLDSQTLLWAAFDAFITGKQAPTAANKVDDARKILVRVLLYLYNEADAAVKAGANKIYIPTPSRHLTTAHMTASAVQAIRDVLAKLGSIGIVSSPELGLAGFLSDCGHGSLIVSLEMWQESPAKAEELKQQLRELVRSIGRHLRLIRGDPKTDGLYTRVWPEALVERGYRGRVVYAVGVLRSPGPLAEGAESVGHCAARLAADFAEKPATYDTTAGRIEVNMASSADFEGLLREPDAGDLTTTDAVVPGLAADLAGVSLNARFRTAAQAIGRLRHDPAHAGKEYDVGYEDRFAGLMWRELEQWGGATEDEEWIPEHRVKQLRRRGDGVVVWDRETRLDET